MGEREGQTASEGTVHLRQEEPECGEEPLGNYRYPVMLEKLKREIPMQQPLPACVHRGCRQAKFFCRHVAEAAERRVGWLGKAHWE